MSRHWLKRAFAALLLAWFVVATTEPAALHLCPVHGGGSSTPAPAEHHAGAHSHDAPAPADEHSTCTCGGDCSAGGFSLALSSVEHRLHAVPLHASDSPGIEAARPRFPARAFLLPYANGPPELRTLA